MFARPEIANPTEAQRKRAERWGQFYRAIDEAVVPDDERILAAVRRERGWMRQASTQLCRKYGLPGKRGRKRRVSNVAEKEFDELAICGDTAFR